jgi:bifunctional non-homologous end joining protein LigD
MSKAKRKGKIFIDYLRNARGATAIVPCSTRARQGAPVALPLSWTELPHVKSASQFNVANTPARLRRQKRDPWHDFDRRRADLSTVLDKLKHA